MKRGVQRPRVGFLVDELDGIGGTELHLLTLLQGLREWGCECELVVLGRAGLADRFEQVGLRVHRWPLRRTVSPGFPLAALRLAHWLRKQRFDLLETIHTAADLIGPVAARLVGVPCISNRRDLGLFKQARHRALGRLVNPLVTAFAAPSQAVADAIARSEGVASDRFVVLPNGVDPVRFAPGRDRRTARVKLGLPPDAPVIGTVASLTPAKRPLILLGAFLRLLRGPLPGLQLVLAGDGPYRARLELQAQAEGVAAQVHLLGTTERPEAVYAALDLHVLASASEGSSNTLLEAMACGLPVVATRVGGTPEVVTDGQNGLLVPPDDVIGLAEAVARLLGDAALRLRLGQGAREQILAAHTLERMVHRHGLLIRTLVAR